MHYQAHTTRIPDPTQAMVGYRLGELHRQAANERLARLARGDADAPGLVAMVKKAGALVARLVTRGSDSRSAPQPAARGIAIEL